jgi:hypothetical protein
MPRVPAMRRRFEVPDALPNRARIARDSSARYHFNNKWLAASRGEATNQVVGSSNLSGRARKFQAASG